MSGGAIENHATIAYQSAVITLFVQVPSYGDVYKYAPQPTILAPLLVVATFALIYTAIWVFDRAPRLRAFLGAPGVTAAVLLGLTVASVVLFRHENARISHGSGSTASPAMSLPVHALAAGRHLYDVHLLGGAPVSPGPGWILLNSPFTLAHVYALFLPFWLGVTALTFRVVYRRPFEVNFALAMLCVSPAFLRLLGEGHDIIAIGCAVVLLVALIDRFVVSDGRAVFFGVAAGVIATARVVYVPLPILLALLVWTRSRRHAAILATVGVLTAVLLLAVFAVGVHPYPPFHLFTRADHRQPTANIILGAGVTAGIVIVAIRRLRPAVASWLCWFAACFSVPVAFIAFGELESSNYAFTSWEGANYLIAGALPVIAAVLASDARGGTPATKRVAETGTSVGAGARSRASGR